MTALFKPFLLLTTRPEEDMARSEYRSFMDYMDLNEHTLIQYRVDQQPLKPVDLNDLSAVIIGGSPFNFSDDPKSHHQIRVETCLTRVISQVIATDFPTFGACYGVGVIGCYAGGHVDRNHGEPAGCIEVTKTADGETDPLLAGLPSSFPTIVGHKEGCSILPPSATLLATGDACRIQMFRLQENIYVTQFHPELNCETFAERLQAYKDGGYYSPGEFEQILAGCAGKDLDTDGRILLNFRERYADWEQ